MSLLQAAFGQKLEKNRLRWLDYVNRREERSVEKVVKVMTVEGRAKRGRPKNTREWTIEV